MCNFKQFINRPITFFHILNIKTKIIYTLCTLLIAYWLSIKIKIIFIAVMIFISIINRIPVHLIYNLITYLIFFSFLSYISIYIALADLSINSIKGTEVFNCGQSWILKEYSSLYMYSLNIGLLTFLILFVINILLMTTIPEDFIVLIPIVNNKNLVYKRICIDVTYMIVLTAQILQVMINYISYVILIPQIRIGNIISSNFLYNVVSVFFLIEILMHELLSKIAYITSVFYTKNKAKVLQAVCMILN
uniref:Conserved hypothetical plastid protein n=1 Tax=Corynoplastis japonica TaxID=700918 RepID=A0A1Y9TMI9_9RHOD|nr:conserved hypothetical plastid protein [Corynoplastis japonica]